MNKQTASIILSRETLERLKEAYSDLYPEELYQVIEALKAMQINDEIEIVKSVFNPPGTFSHPLPRFNN